MIDRNETGSTIASDNNSARTKSLAVMEMLRWISGNRDIRHRYGIATIVEKLGEGHRRWCGRAIRINN